MPERGVCVEHATITRWVLKYRPPRDAAFHRRKRPIWISWRLDEPDIRGRGQWRYLSRALDKSGQTMAFLLTTQRDRVAALCFRPKAIRRHGVPETITMEGSAANAAAIQSDTAPQRTAIAMRQVR
jgi:putative transposase